MRIFCVSRLQQTVLKPLRSACGRHLENTGHWYAFGFICSFEFDILCQIICSLQVSLPLIEKLKERKASVTEALANALDAVFASVRAV